MVINNSLVYSSVKIVFFLLIIIYFLQGILYPNGSIISQISLALFLFISFFHFVLTFFNKKNYSYLFLSWSLFLILNVAGYFFGPDYSNIEYNSFGMFKRVMFFLLPFYTTYYLTQKGSISYKFFSILLFFMVPVTILQFYSQETAIKLLSQKENIVNNVSYSFVVLIPLVFFVKKRIYLAISILILILLFIILGAKRGALVAGVFGAIIFFYSLLSTMKSKYKTLNMFLLFVIFIVISLFIFDFFLSNEYLLERFSKIDASGDGTSGRNIIYKAIFNGWINSDNFFNLIFGFGFASSLYFAGNFAHNDWFEVLSNFGIFGFIVYLNIYISLVKIYFNKKYLKEDRNIVLCIIILLFMLSLFSMGYTSYRTFIFSLILGFLCANFKKKKNENTLYNR